MEYTLRRLDLEATAPDLRLLLVERGYPFQSGRGGTTVAVARTWLSEQPDFVCALSILEQRFVTDWSRHLCIKLPKYHPEFNPIERLWAFSKRYCRDHCMYSIVGLRKVVPESLNRASVEMCGKFFAKIDWIEEQYRNGASVYDLEMSKQRKSHRTGKEGDRFVASYGTRPTWGGA